MTTLYNFDIDVDVSDIVGDEQGDSLLDSRWYELSQPRSGRCRRLQSKLDSNFRNALLRAQWLATQRRTLDRRRAIRVPLISRVHLGDKRQHMVATDISLSGMRCSGTPTAPIMDVEFKIPGLPFPIDVRTEVMSFKDANVLPLVGLRFVSIEKPYLHHIAQYIENKRQRQLAA